MGMIALVLVLTGAGCIGEDGSYTKDGRAVEETQMRLQESTPIPAITNSAERQNISDRALLFDDLNKVSYIYLISYGKVMAFYPVKGKVSSLNSFLSPLDKLVDYKGRDCGKPDTGSTCYVVSAPDIDGAYGENAEGVFFFTTDGAYVEWSGDYMMSDFPLQLSTPPELVRTIE